jgi:hypothetical protein
MREPVILWEGACAYVLHKGARYEIRVFSSNSVQHVVAGETEDGARAESVCRRLNAYPRQTRQAHGLL